MGYRVGDDEFSADVIEHGVLRRNRRPPFGARRLLRRRDRRLAALPSEVDPRIHFALNCGARSCPAIRSYGAGEIERQLELATRSYVSEETTVDRAAGRVTLPKLLRIYRADFGPKDAQLEFVASRLEAEDAAWVRDNRDGLRVGYGSYDWTITLDA